MAEGHVFRNDVDVLGDVSVQDILNLGVVGFGGTNREIKAVGSAPDISVDIVPQGSGLLRVPSGYATLIGTEDRAVINRGYFKQYILANQADATAQAPGAGQDQFALVYDHPSTKWTLKAVATALIFTDGVTNTAGTVRLGGDIDEAITNIKQIATGDIFVQAFQGTNSAGLKVYSPLNNDNRVEIFYGATSKIALQNDSFTVTANVTGSMKYAADYAGLFTSDRSIPDKGWINTHIGGKDVTALITNPGGPENGWAIKWDNVAGKYTLAAIVSGGSGHTIQNSGSNLPTQPNLNFTNGLTAINDIPNTASVVKLGGALIEDTTLTRDNGAGQFTQIFIDPVGIQLLSESDSAVGNGIFLSSLDTFSTNQVSISIVNTTGSFLIIDDRLTPTGIQYQGNYGANFTARSLIDKGYADATYAIISGSGNYWKTTGTTTLLGSPSIERTFAAVSNNEYWVRYTGTITHDGGAAETLFFKRIVPTITTNANNQISIGQDIDVTFNGTGTGIKTIGQRIVNGGLLLGTSWFGNPVLAAQGIQVIKSSTTNVIGLLIQNITAGTAALTSITLVNNATSSGDLLYTASNFTATAIRANGMAVSNAGTGGISLVAGHASSGIISFATGGSASTNTRVTIDQTGATLFALTGADTLTAGAKFDIKGAGTSASTWGLYVRNSSNVKTLSITDAGQLALGSGTGHIAKSSDSFSTDIAGHGFLFTVGVSQVSDGNIAIGIAQSTNWNNTSGSRSVIGTVPNGIAINPTSGTANFSYLRISPTYNQTGATGSIFGLNYTPTVTSVSGTHYAIFTGSGSILFGNANSDTITANTRFDLRGVGLTTGLLFRGADSANTERVKILDNGNLYWTQASQSVTNNFVLFEQAAHTGGSPFGFTFSGGSHTTLAASVEATDFSIDLSRTVQFSNGALALQRAVRIEAPTYSHVSGSNTIIDAYTFYVDGPPLTTGGFTTITNPWAGGFGGNVFINGVLDVGLGVAFSSTIKMQGGSTHDSVITYNTSDILSITSVGRTDINGGGLTVIAPRVQVISSVVTSGGSGTATFFGVVSTINTSGGFSGVMRGIVYAPTETSLSGVTAHYGLLVDSATALSGFGIATPTAKLQVRGIGTTSDFTLLLENSGGTDRFGFRDDGKFFHYVTPANDNALTHVLVLDTGTGEVKYRSSGTLGGGGGSSAGANNEVQTSDGAGAFVASKLFFNETTGAMVLGDSSLSGNRSITTDSSGGTAALILSNEANLASINLGGTVDSNGIGITSPSHIHLIKSTALTNAVSYIKLLHETSGTPAIGIGVGLQFDVETTAGNETGATIDVVTTDVGSGTEDFDIVLNTMAAGATAAERLRISSVENISSSPFVIKKGNYPYLNIFRPSVLPDDTIMHDIFFDGYSDTSVQRTYARLRTIMRSDVNTAENGELNIDVVQAGTITTYIYVRGNASSIDFARNVTFFTTGVNYQSMVNGTFMANVSTAPTGNPTSGAFNWVDGADDNIAKWRSTTGVIRRVWSQEEIENLILSYL